MLLVTNPRTGKEEPIQSVLNHIVSQEGYDSPEDDIIQQAANHIDYLEICIETERRACEEIKNKVLNLLSVIYRDGGHYVAAKGLDRAVEKAIIKVADWIQGE